MLKLHCASDTGSPLLLSLNVILGHRWLGNITTWKVINPWQEGLWRCVVCNLFRRSILWDHVIAAQAIIFKIVLSYSTADFHFMNFLMNLDLYRNGYTYERVMANDKQRTITSSWLSPVFGAMGKAGRKKEDPPHDGSKGRFWKILIFFAHICPPA